MMVWSIVFAVCIQYPRVDSFSRLCFREYMLGFPAHLAPRGVRAIEEEETKRQEETHFGAGE